MAKLASLIPSVGSALGIFVVNNLGVTYIEPFPKPLEGIPYESMAISTILVGWMQSEKLLD